KDSHEPFSRKPSCRLCLSATVHTAAGGPTNGCAHCIERSHKESHRANHGRLLRSIRRLEEATASPPIHIFPSTTYTHDGPPCCWYRSPRCWRRNGDGTSGCARTAGRCRLFFWWGRGRISRCRSAVLHLGRYDRRAFLGAAVGWSDGGGACRRPGCCRGWRAGRRSGGLRYL
ncbi:hypothetical protein FA13DRAFT_1813113, partial [Coprinellus micaceus]